MPLYQKTANKLFVSQNPSSISTLTKHQVTIKQGEPFVHANPPQQYPYQSQTVLDQSNPQRLNQPNRLDQLYQQSLNQSKSQQLTNSQSQLTQSQHPRLKQTRPKILIVPKRDPRSLNGTRTTMDEAFNTKHEIPKDFKKEANEAKTMTKSQITHLFTIKDGYKSDVYRTTNQQDYSEVPTQYPVGFMQNQGISSMYANYTHSGKFDKEPLSRRPGGNK
ncbi:Conserved_hypothetical protein [Hexamita inflata]|uniref:Uncharacterized protein n=1 Tax=Hexamita inflata TaxID=28002 RepID=A0AA86NLA9_9EUKA|nr:Conserved hypothetical protein [Hexamita inflata]